MSWLDIAMAAGAVVLVVLIILRKKARWSAVAIPLWLPARRA